LRETLFLSSYARAITSKLLQAVGEFAPWHESLTERLLKRS
jgi:hypothetical protein